MEKPTYFAPVTGVGATLAQVQNGKGERKPVDGEDKDEDDQIQEV